MEMFLVGRFVGASQKRLEVLRELTGVLFGFWAVVFKPCLGLEIFRCSTHSLPAETDDLIVELDTTRYIHARIWNKRQALGPEGGEEDGYECNCDDRGVDEPIHDTSCNERGQQESRIYKNRGGQAEFNNLCSNERMLKCSNDTRNLFKAVGGSEGEDLPVRVDPTNLGS